MACYKPVLCTVPGCRTKHFEQVEGQATIYVYTLDSKGEVERYAVCSTHYMMSIGMQGVYETEEEARNANSCCV